VGGRAAATGEEYAGPLAYLQQLDRHRYEFPFEELRKMLGAARNGAIPAGLGEAMDPVLVAGTYAEGQHPAANGGGPDSPIGGDAVSGRRSGLRLHQSRLTIEIV
jgi:hypothetical protein